jgi:hypothetical protein
MNGAKGEKHIIVLSLLPARAWYFILLQQKKRNYLKFNCLRI